MENDIDLSGRIGRRIADRRAELALTLDAMAALTGVSRAMISRIERGEVHASAVVLDRLCGGLGLTLSELFAQERPEPLLRLAEQPVWRDPDSGYLRREVAPPGTGSPVRIVEVTFPAGAEVVFSNGSLRSVGQHVWMLEGVMEVTAGGTVHRLEGGDCLHMRLAPGNRFHNPGPSAARYAVILSMEPSS